MRDRILRVARVHPPALGTWQGNPPASGSQASAESPRPATHGPWEGPINATLPRKAPQAPKAVIELPTWLRQLRDAEIVDRVRSDPRSIPGTYLGVDSQTAIQEVTRGGQAAFDEPWNDLSPDDRVLLYAHFFQLGHLEELIEAGRQLFEASRIEAPIVVDLGCGPFTGGLAIASMLGRKTRVDYVGVDRSAAMHRLGERLASEAERSHGMPTLHRRWAADISSIDWNRAPGWRPVIVIASYLLASPTLDAVALVTDLDRLLTRLGRGPVTIFYTNAVGADANRGFPGFRAALRDAGFEVVADDTGEIEISRQSREKPRLFRYALFQRQRQDTLHLG